MLRFALATIALAAAFQATSTLHNASHLACDNPGCHFQIACDNPGCRDFQIACDRPGCNIFPRTLVG